MSEWIECGSCGGTGENYEINDEGHNLGLRTCPKCGGSGRKRPTVTLSQGLFNPAIELAIKHMGWGDEF